MNPIQVRGHVVRRGPTRVTHTGVGSAIQQGLNDLRLAVAAACFDGGVQRGIALGIFPVRVGPGLEQQSDDRAIVLAVPAETLQGRQPVPIDRRWPGAGIQQGLDHADVGGTDAGKDGHVQGGLTGVVGSVEVGAVLQ